LPLTWGSAANLLAAMKIKQPARFLIFFFRNAAAAPIFSKKVEKILFFFKFLSFVVAFLCLQVMI
jgi:hypothetical protein